MPIRKYTDTERRCYRCQRMKSIDDFGTDRSKPKGKSYLCKECGNKKKAEWRRKNGITNSKIKYRAVGIRWKILQRDNFTCQYCGRKAPDIQLEVDHIVPRSKGGKYTENNLITACKDCNLGKRDNLLI